MDAIERIIIETIDAHANELTALSTELTEYAEPGFFEVRTSARIAKAFADYDLPMERGFGLTGLRATMEGGASGPCAAIIGELDGIMCPQHPNANPENGISHACGHNLQLTALVGAALALSQPEVRKALCGSVAFWAVPAEEYLAADTRRALRKKGVEFCCGKSELLRTGAFDGVDLALTTHVHMSSCTPSLLLGNVTSTGALGKRVTFCGKAAHAAAAPHEGINALNAAALALSAIGMLRETFKEEDSVRIHANIVEGGTAINVVPHEVILEAMVRTNNLSVLAETAAKFDRACIGAAQALGAQAKIETLQGYMPVRYSPADKAMVAAADTLGVDYACVNPDMKNFASTDVGDLSHVMPIVNFTHGGVRGALHSADFAVTDEALARLVPAKMMALATYHLLRDGAADAHSILDAFQPVYTRQGYINAVRGQFTR